MIRALEQGDTLAALGLLRERPLQNVFLEHVVGAGMLGAIPGFSGCFESDELIGILFVGAQGGTALAVRDERAIAELAASARRLVDGPQHIIGAEQVTEPF